MPLLPPPICSRLLEAQWLLDDTEQSAEELTLAYIRDLAESSLNGERVSDIVLAVSPSYTQHERDAIINVEIA